MGLLDRLRARKLAQEEVVLPADPVGYASAERAVERAERAVLQGQAAGRTDLGPEIAALADARAVLTDQPVEVFTVRCLAAERYEELVEDHPPTDPQRKQGWLWNVDSFRPALLAAAVSTAEGEPDLAELDWRQLARDGNLAVGELDLLFYTAVQLNTRQPQVSTGKG